MFSAVLRQVLSEIAWEEQREYLENAPGSVAHFL
jgi:hypothetical protein